MEVFIKKLIDAGLYEDEARVMLDTWNKSYFQSEGLKVFWIAPAAFTNSILPLQITPAPNTVKRVIVGRSEVLSPEFEKELAAMTRSDLVSKYKNDRFLMAYEQVTAFMPVKLTDYNGPVAGPLAGSVTDMDVFPNPAGNQLIVRIRQPGTIRIFTAAGGLVKYISGVAGENIIDITELAKGVYFIKAEYENGGSASKK